MTTDQKRNGMALLIEVENDLIAVLAKYRDRLLAAMPEQPPGGADLLQNYAIVSATALTKWFLAEGTVPPEWQVSAVIFSLHQGARIGPERAFASPPGPKH